MKIKGLLLAIIFVFSIAGALYYCNADPVWIIENIEYEARDGFKIQAFLLKPKQLKGTYPLVACFHHAWGNRDDFLKLFPHFANAGIIAISPNLLRQKPGYKRERYRDLIDTLQHMENQKYIDNSRIGIVTSSFSVNTGAMAIYKRPNVIANVMLSGPITMEHARKWLTLNTDLAIFAIVSIYEEANYYLMKEYLSRNLNPHSRSFFLNNDTQQFIVEEHGTYILDTYPESMPKITEFFTEVFDLKRNAGGSLKTYLPEETIIFPSSDGIPIFATFIPPKEKSYPTIVLYPPRYNSRTYYDDVVQQLREKGFGILVPNNKRTCRYKETEYLCDREIKGAIHHLLSEHKMDEKKLILVFPSPYFAAAGRLLQNDELSVKMVLLAGQVNYEDAVDIDMLKKKYSNVVHIRTRNKKEIISAINDHY